MEAEKSSRGGSSEKSRALTGASVGELVGAGLETGGVKGGVGVSGGA